MKPVLFLICHGVEYKELPDDYAAKFSDAIEARLPIGSPVTFKGYNWSRLIDEREKTTFDTVKQSHSPVRWWILRLICFVLCDTWWYLRSRIGSGGGDTYNKIHDGLRREVETFKKSSPDGIVVICGHSWGSQVALDACYQGFQVDALVTMGSCIYYLSGSYDDWGKPPVLKGWINFFNPLDPIATRIDDNPNFKDAVKVIHVASFNPFNWTSIRAHCHYWVNSVVHDRIAEFLLKISIN